MANENNANHEDGAVIHIDTDDEEPINIDSDAENNIDSDAENNIGADDGNHIDSDVENNVGSDAENNIGLDGENHVGSDAENHVGSDGENHIESISIDSESDASMNSGAEMQNNCHSRSDSGSDNQSYSNSDEASGSDIDGQSESGSDNQYHNNISGYGSTSDSQRSYTESDHQSCSDSAANSELSNICASEDEQNRINPAKRRTSKSAKQPKSDSNNSRSDLEEDNFSDATSYTIGSNESHLSKSESDNDDLDDCSGCYENHQHVYSSYKPNFSLRIANILRGYGDGPAPKDDTVLMVEKIVVQQMRALINDLIRISDRKNGHPDPKQTDFEFLMRRSPNKIARLRKYIRDMEFRSRYREMMNGKLPRNVANIGEHLGKQSNVNKQQSGEAYDDEVIRRLVRADRISDILHGEDYLEYSDARKTSFHWRNFGDAKNLLKVLNIPEHWEFSSMAYAILGYLVHETIHTLVDYAILTRLNSKNLRKDPLERLIPEGN